MAHRPSDRVTGGSGPSCGRQRRVRSVRRQHRRAEEHGQQPRHDIRLESRFTGGTFRLPGYMGGTQNTGAVKPSSPPVAAWVDLARRLAHGPRRGWRSAAWPLSPSRLDASVSSAEPHTPAPDEQEQSSPPARAVCDRHGWAHHARSPTEPRCRLPWRQRTACAHLLLLWTSTGTELAPGAPLSHRGRITARERSRPHYRLGGEGAALRHAGVSRDNRQSPAAQAPRAKQQPAGDRAIIADQGSANRSRNRCS
jgi:hypothetical protein